MSGGGGDKPKPTPVSEGEKIQAKLAKDQYAYYAGTYAPLAKNMADAAEVSYEGRLAGQNKSAAMREGSKTLQSVAASGGMADTNTLAGAVTEAGMEGLNAGKLDQNSRRFEALQVGLGGTADATRSLSTAANIQTNSAIEKVRFAMQDDQSSADEKNALYGAAGSLAAAGGTYYGMKKFGPTQKPDGWDTDKHVQRSLTMSDAQKRRGIGVMGVAK